jgi:DNA-binding transcriptional LysR family regulator
MVDFKNLEALVWIARLGGFRAAAERINTTQPAVSSRVALLEQELGFSLLDRGAKGATPTARGRVVLGYAERLIALRTEMLQHVMEPASLRGTVRLGVSETLVHTWLSQLIERLHQNHPQIVLDIEVDNTLRLRNALVSSQLDVALLLGPVSEPRMANAPLSRYPLAFVARPDLGLHGPSIPLSELLAWPIITYQRLTRPYIAVQEVFARARLDPPRIYANSSLATIVRMALDGIGVALIPPAVIPRELGEARLMVVDVAANIPPLDYTVTWPALPGSHLAETVAKLAQQVSAEAE